MADGDDGAKLYAAYQAWLKTKGLKDTEALFQSFLDEQSPITNPSAAEVVQGASVYWSADKAMHAVRALGIFFIRSAVASLVCLPIIVIGIVITVTSRYGYIIGQPLIVIGAVLLIIWEVGVIIQANRELKKSE